MDSRKSNHRVWFGRNGRMCSNLSVRMVRICSIHASLMLTLPISAPKSIRGAIVMVSQLTTTIGLLVAAIVNQAALKLTGNKSWRIPIAIQIAFAGILCLGMLFLPESPRYYIKRGRKEEALRALSRLRQRNETDPEVLEEFEDMVKNVESSPADKSGYLDCFRQGNNKTRTRILTGLGFLGVQQLTGTVLIFEPGVDVLTPWQE
jgi:SP family sugar:H+ symporter-like MFS transporter